VNISPLAFVVAQLIVGRVNFASPVVLMTEVFSWRKPLLELKSLFECEINFTDSSIVNRPSFDVIIADHDDVNSVINRIMTRPFCLTKRLSMLRGVATASINLLRDA
jgi:hypothetical protein